MGFRLPITIEAFGNCKCFSSKTVGRRNFENVAKLNGQQVLACQSTWQACKFLPEKFVGVCFSFSNSVWVRFCSLVVWHADNTGQLESRFWIFGIENHNSHDALTINRSLAQAVLPSGLLETGQQDEVCQMAVLCG